MIRNVTFLLFGIGLFVSCSNPPKAPENNHPESIESPTNKVVLSSEIVWEKLNPARGDSSPQAGTVWGDRKGDVATGFLAKFIDGFSSPPHIHNVTYRAVVMKGLVHNDDEAAANMWMPKGSFWTQPVGQPHITSAKGEENIAYVEIDRGPYLVLPTEDAFDNGERPVNVDASNVVWLDHEQSNWIEPESNAEISFLWEHKTEKGLKGLFVKLPAKAGARIESDGTIFHAIVVQGEMKYTMPQNKEVKVLDAGSYFNATERAIHSIYNDADDKVIVYVRTNGKMKIFGSETGNEH